MDKQVQLLHDLLMDIRRDTNTAIYQIEYLIETENEAFEKLPFSETFESDLDTVLRMIDQLLYLMNDNKK